MATTEDPAAGIMPVAELKPLLVLSKRQPVSCAVGLTKDKQGIVLLHRRTRPRKLLAELRRKAGAGVSLDATSLRFGRATVDGANDSTTVHFTVNKPAPGVLRTKLLERLRPAGFQHCEIHVDEALETEADDDGDGENADTGPEHDGVADPSDDEGTRAGTGPAQQSPVPASVELPGGADQPTTDEVRADLMAMARRIASAIEAAPERRTELLAIATGARDRLKAGDLAGAVTGMEALRRALGPAGATGSATGTTAPATTGPAKDAAGGAGASTVPQPIDPASLPPGPLSGADYAAVGTRNKYLAGKYDPESLGDRAINVVTGSMHDPANVLTDAERAEHRALTARIAETLEPRPTPQEARLDAMEASPLGAIASVAARGLGGGQAAQDAALDAGTTADGLGIAFAGARAGPATRFLGAQTGEGVPVVHEEKGGEQPLAALPAPSGAEPPPFPPTADDQISALRGHGDVRHGTATTTAQQATRVLAGVAPDGRKARTSRATRFDSPEAQLDAVNRALQQVQARDRAGDISHNIVVNTKGQARLPRESVVVSGFPGGYGSGVQLQGGSAKASGLKIEPTGQDPNAMVVLEKDPITGIWHTVTQYPTNLPVTP